MHRLGTAALAVAIAFMLSACGGSSTSTGPVTGLNTGAAAGDNHLVAANEANDAQPQVTALPVRVAAQNPVAPPFASAVSFPPAVSSALVSEDFDFPAVSFDSSQSQLTVSSEGYAVMAPQGETSSGSTDLARAAYRLQVGSYAGSGQPQTLGLQWDAQRMPHTRQLWVGLANWNAGRWDWFEGPDDDTLSLTSLAPYTDAQGETAVVVVLAGIAPAALERLQLGAPELRAMGALQDGRSASSVPETTVKAASSLPGSFDLSAQCSPVTNQGSVGACTAFAIGNGAMNYELKRVYGGVGWDFASDYNLVSQKYLYGVTGVDQGLGCPSDGRYLGPCVSYLTIAGNGIATYHNAPYTNVCDYSWSQDALDDAAVLQAESYEFIPTGTTACLDVLRTMLAVYNRPVIIGLNVDNAFTGYVPDSVWDYTGPPIGGHAVLVVGYDDAKGAFKIRNSWGTGWGTSGHGWIGYTTFSTNTGTWVEAYDLWAEYDPAVQERFFPGASLIPPTNLAATDGTYADRVRLTWTAAANATSYKIYRADASNGAYAQVGTSVTTSFNDMAVPDSAIYWYRVASANASGDSSQGPSESGNLRLSAPTGLTATDGTYTDHIRISWNSVPNAASYKLYRATSQTGTYNLISSPGATFYDDPRPTTASFWYKVAATNVQGDSQLSNGDNGNASLAAPLGIAASDGTFTDHVRITWSATPGAVSYKLFRAGSEFGTYTLIASPAVTNYNDPVLVATPLWYKVRAVNADGESMDSASEAGNAELPAPTALSASDGTLADHVHLSWTGGLTQYKIFRASSQTGVYSQIGTSNNTQYNDYVGVTTQYWYQVRATNANGDSQPSNANAGNAALATPTGFDASDAEFSDHVHLSWNSVTGATGYNVYRANSQNGSYILLTTQTDTQYDDFTPLSYSYWYKVKARNASGGLSIFSTANAGNAGLAAPANVAATNGAFTDHIRLDWKAAPNATGYRIFRAASSAGPYAEIGTTAKLVWDDPQQTTAVFLYKVKSIGASGDSWFSAPVSGRVSLAAPVGVIASDGAFSNRVHLSWGGVSGATQYKVYRSATESGSYILLATLTGRQYDDYLPLTYRYWYKVKASNASGDSQPSNADSGYVGVGAPQNVQATDGTLSGRIRITWDAVPGATKYKVYRWTGLEWDAITATTAPKYDHLVPDTKQRYYRVIATGDTGDSVPSAYDTGYAAP